MYICQLFKYFSNVRTCKDVCKDVCLYASRAALHTLTRVYNDHTKSRLYSKTDVFAHKKMEFFLTCRNMCVTQRHTL